MVLSEKNHLVKFVRKLYKDRSIVRIIRVSDWTSLLVLKTTITSRFGPGEYRLTYKDEDHVVSIDYDDELQSAMERHPNLVIFIDYKN